MALGKAIASLFVDIRGDTTRLRGDTRNALKEFDRLGKRIGAKSKEIVTQIGPAVGALGVGLVKIAADYEASMNRVKAITGATGDEFQKLDDVAQELGRSTQFRASEVAEAMTFLGMAGFDTNEIVKAIPGTLDLAAASAIDLASAADIVSNVMSQFGADASETNRFVDLLAKTVTTANVDMEQLSEAMKHIGPVAQSLKVPVEEVAAVIGKLGDFGIQGGIATRSLRTSLLRLADPPKEAADAIADLRLEFFEKDGGFKGIIGVVEQLETGLKGLTDQQRAAALSAIFGSESTAQWSALMQVGSGTLEEYQARLADSEGAAKQMAETMNTGVIGAWKRMVSAFEGAAIELTKTSGLLDLTAASLDNLGLFITSLGDNKALQDWFINVMDVGSLFTEFWRNLNNAVEGTFEQINRKTSYHMDVFTGTVKGSLNTVKNLFVDADEEIVRHSIVPDMFKSIVDEAISWRKDFTREIDRGVTSTEDRFRRMAATMDVFGRLATSFAGSGSVGAVFGLTSNLLGSLFQFHSPINSLHGVPGPTATSGLDIPQYGGGGTTVNQIFEAGVSQSQLAEVLPKVEQAAIRGVAEAYARGGDYRRVMRS